MPILLNSSQSPSGSTSAQPPSSTLNSVRLTTPAWDPAESSHMLNPAWDPSSQSSPRTEVGSGPKHWLDDQKLQGSRLKLKTNDLSVQSPYVEFLGVENGLIKVRDKIDIKYLVFASVDPLQPTSKGDLVTPKAGEMRGVHFTVVRITGDKCVVRKPGTRPTKKTPDTEFTTSDLVQVHPAFR